MTGWHIGCMAAAILFVLIWALCEAEAEHVVGRKKGGA